MSSSHIKAHTYSPEGDWRCCAILDFDQHSIYTLLRRRMSGMAHPALWQPQLDPGSFCRLAIDPILDQDLPTVPLDDQRVYDRKAQTTTLRTFVIASEGYVLEFFSHSPALIHNGYLPDRVIRSGFGFAFLVPDFIGDDGLDFNLYP